MPKAKANNRKDILLLLLYSPGQTDEVNEPIVGRTRLVKMLFLFKEEVLARFKKGLAVTSESFYEFFPWDFGPFSVQVYDDLTFFILRNFVVTSESEEELLAESSAEQDLWESSSGIDYGVDETADFVEESISLTGNGVAFTAPMYDGLSLDQRNLLKEFKARLVRAPLRAILRYVYTHYPDQTERSKIRGNILGTNS